MRATPHKVVDPPDNKVKGREAAQAVGIGITGEEDGLEEDHAGNPHLADPPNQGRIALGDEGLDQEQR
jgi:hypothetical protein